MSATGKYIVLFLFLLLLTGPAWAATSPSDTSDESQITIEPESFEPYIPQWYFRVMSSPAATQEDSDWLAEFDWISGEADDSKSDPSPPQQAHDSAVMDDKPESFEELLAQRDGVEFQYGGQTYVWQDGVPFARGTDGQLIEIEQPKNLYVIGDDGQQWLSQEADGTIFIEVAPKIWATINFAHASDQIEEDSKPVLDIFGASLSSPALAHHSLIIAGHTNNIGKPEYNLKLSQKRALSVSRYLHEIHHIEPERMILHGYGDTRPIADNNTALGLELNRRVEFILIGPQDNSAQDVPAEETPSKTGSLAETSSISPDVEATSTEDDLSPANPADDAATEAAPEKANSSEEADMPTIGRDEAMEALD